MDPRWISLREKPLLFEHKSGYDSNSVRYGRNETRKNVSVVCCLKIVKCIFDFLQRIKTVVFLFVIFVSRFGDWE